MTVEQRAKRIWTAIRNNLSDRSFDVTTVDDETLADLEAEQVLVIQKGLNNQGNECYIKGYANGYERGSNARE